MSDLIASHVSSAQALKALSALQAHIVKQQSQAKELPLDGGVGTDEVVFLQVAVKRLSATKQAKPVRIQLPHSPHNAESSVLLLVKDPQREYKNLLVEHKIKDVERVVGVEKLKGKFKPFEARRQLETMHDIVLADDRILPTLPKLLGRKWIEGRKNPIPVDIAHTKNDRLRKSIEGALSSTYYTSNKGSQASIRLGTFTTLTAQQLLENLSAVIPVIISKVQGGWTNIQGMEVKTSRSAALPIWNCALGELWDGAEEPGQEMRFGGPLEADEQESDEEQLEVIERVHKKKPASAMAGKKEAAADKKRTSSAAKPDKAAKKEEKVKVAAKKAAPAVAAKAEAPAAKAKKSSSAASPATAKKLAKLAKLQKSA